MVQTLQTPFIFAPAPLALPEPLDSKLRRVGIEPWMIAGEDKEFRAGVTNVGKVRAFELIDAIDHQNPTPWGQKMWDFLYEIQVTEVMRWSYGERAGQPLLLEETRATKLLADRLRSLAHSIAREAVAKIHAARARRAYRKKVRT